MTLTAIPPKSVGLDAPTSAYTTPPGFMANHLSFSDEECKVIASAYADDSTPILSIPLSDIYAVATTSGKVPKMHLDKIKPWIGVRFFAISVPGCSMPLLYAPTSF